MMFYGSGGFCGLFRNDEQQKGEKQLFFGDKRANELKGRVFLSTEQIKL